MKRTKLLVIALGMSLDRSRCELSRILHKP